nr:phenylacetaldehyde oxime monooxygenase CYP71AN24-like [Ziziphus jujuba var. spinosa]
MKTHDIVFSNRPNSTAEDILYYGCIDTGFAPYGEYWRDARKICVLELLSLKRVESFQYVRDEEVAVLVNKIRKARLEDHKAALKQPSSSEAKDFVDILLQLQNDGVLDVEFSNVNLKAILLGLFVGGSDMVSTALEWTMSELSRNDKILRPHPPAVLIFRQTSESVKLGAYHIAPKTRVLITTWAIQRDQNFGDRPEEEFVPERFENNHVDFKGLDFQFIPFGVGRRRCPGSTFGVFYD